MASAMSAEVTEPKSLPSSPARAGIRRPPAAISLEAMASYSVFCFDCRVSWARFMDSACFTTPLAALIAIPCGTR